MGWGGVEWAEWWWGVVVVEKVRAAFVHDARTATHTYTPPHRPPPHGRRQGVGAAGAADAGGDGPAGSRHPGEDQPQGTTWLLSVFSFWLLRGRRALWLFDFGFGCGCWGGVVVGAPHMNNSSHASAIFFPFLPPPLQRQKEEKEKEKVKIISKKVRTDVLHTYVNHLTPQSYNPTSSPPFFTRHNLLCNRPSGVPGAEEEAAGRGGGGRRLRGGGRGAAGEGVGVLLLPAGG